MAGLITPLSRRPRWLLLFLVPSLGLALPASVAGVINSPTPFPNAEWLGVLGTLVFAGLVYRNFASVAVTDYDADYLYLFQKTGTQQIPLGSFYKLVAARGWQLRYLDEQHQKQAVQIVTLGTSWFHTNDSSSIHGFIDAVGQHNPNLDVRHGLFG